MQGEVGARAVTARVDGHHGLATGELAEVGPHLAKPPHLRLQHAVAADDAFERRKAATTRVRYSFTKYYNYSGITDVIRFTKMMLPPQQVVERVDAEIHLHSRS